MPVYLPLGPGRAGGKAFKDDRLFVSLSNLNVNVLTIARSLARSLSLSFSVDVTICQVYASCAFECMSGVYSLL